MAGFGIFGMDELCLAFEKSAEVPKEVKKEILTAMGEVTCKAQKEMGETLGIRDPESSEHILDKIKVGRIQVGDGTGSVSVYFDGTRTDAKHKKTIRNAEIAFLNEFGVPNKSSSDKKAIPARPFIKTAIEMNADKINEAGEQIFRSWQDSLFE